MSNWWELQQASGGEPQPGVRAIAYYRHSAQDRQENSIPIQQDQVREWAAKNGVRVAVPDDLGGAEDRQFDFRLGDLHLQLLGHPQEPAADPAAFADAAPTWATAVHFLLRRPFFGLSRARFLSAIGYHDSAAPWQRLSEVEHS